MSFLGRFLLFTKRKLVFDYFWNYTSASHAYSPQMEQKSYLAF
ncbi:hypothetical protein ACVWYG_003404 [Pedobacter sp. UYEF25]